MSKRGFTLIEVLLSLLITSLIVINCSLLYKTLYFSNYGNKIDARLENGVIKRINNSAFYRIWK